MARYNRWHEIRCKKLWMHKRFHSTNKNLKRNKEKKKTMWQEKKVLWCAEHNKETLAHVRACICESIPERGKSNAETVMSEYLLNMPCSRTLANTHTHIQRQDPAWYFTPLYNFNNMLNLTKRTLIFNGLLDRRQENDPI